MPDGGKRSAMDQGDPTGQVVLGTPDGHSYARLPTREESFGLSYSPLARKIVTFNLVALCLMMTGILYLNQFDESLVLVRESALETDARLVAEAVTLVAEQAGTPAADSDEDRLGDTAVGAFYALSEQTGTHMQLYDINGDLRAYSATAGPVEGSRPARMAPGAADETGLFTILKERFLRLFDRREIAPPTLNQRIRFTQPSLRSALAGNLRRARVSDAEGNIMLSVALPLVQGNNVLGAVVLSTDPGEIDAVIRRERGQILRIFFLAMVISVILSMALANTIAHPLQELAEAAEKSGAMNAHRFDPDRIEIPDLTGRPDEIGYLAGAMKSMTEALYERIDANESFAADVAHEIKNPLTSLRSAVETMRYAHDDTAREKLLRVIMHDVARLDRLVTDISNASRLDSELVRDEMRPFDLGALLRGLADHHRIAAADKGGVIHADLPRTPVMINGLEGRLAQVFVNLITNALSFIGEGGHIAVRLQPGQGEVTILIEDNGPGIPDDNLADVFARFYSERPGQPFGDHSGLGLAISKQIVTAHAGSIHAENIRPEGAPPGAPSHGARFVVRLPI